MARLLLLTNSTGASAEVLPALSLLQHNVKILPAVASVLVDIPEVDVLFIDARRDLSAAKSLTHSPPPFYTTPFTLYLLHPPKNDTLSPLYRVVTPLKIE